MVIEDILIADLQGRTQAAPLGMRANGDANVVPGREQQIWQSYRDARHWFA